MAKAARAIARPRICACYRQKPGCVAVNGISPRLSRPSRVTRPFAHWQRASVRRAAGKYANTGCSGQTARPDACTQDQPRRWRASAKPRRHEPGRSPSTLAATVRWFSAPAGADFGPVQRLPERLPIFAFRQALLLLLLILLIEARVRVLD